MKKGKPIRLILPRNHYRTDDVFNVFADDVICRSRKHDLPAILTENDIILFEGGTDVSPSLYGEKFNSRTENPDRPRDAYETFLYKKGLVAGASFIGICRGAQLLTALYGGKLIQHVTAHGSPHLMMTHDGQTLMASSIHHQMMNPFVLPPSKYKILAHPPKELSTCYWGESDTEELELPAEFVEPEVIWYPEIKALAIQGHPEFCDQGSKYRAYCVELARRLIVNGQSL